MKRFTVHALSAGLGLLFVVASGGILSRPIDSAHLTKAWRFTGGDSVMLYADREIFSDAIDFKLAENLFSQNHTADRHMQFATSGTWRTAIRASRELLSAKERGLVVTVSRRTPLVLIQREKFTGSVEEGYQVDSVRVRLMDGPHKGFEGWTRAVELQEDPRPGY
jgi:hypothetical protein